MRNILLATCLSPFALLIVEGAHAQTTVSTATTAPLATSTAGDVTIDSTGSITPVAAGAAVTIDRDNAVSNSGTISFTDIDGATGIAATAGRTGTITNAGTITVTETDASADTDSDGDDDTPLATGSNRAGIATAGAFTGAITNTGTITVVGNTSAGIAANGLLTGTLTSSGTIAATGTGSYGVHTQAVNGDVILSGTISAVGGGASGVAIDGDVSGAVTIAGTVTTTGFRDIAAADSTILDADDLLIGGPALRIAGNVAGGVTIALDDTLGTGVLTSYGSAPALLVGSTSQSVTLGTVADATNGLVIAGSVYSYGLYSGTSATAVQIGGTGAAATVTGGITVSGAVAATSAAGTTASYGILIGSGATVPSLFNSGSIVASSTGSAGTATAIADLSGSLTSLTNTGTISATVAGTLTAIDLSANTSGVTITQSQNADSTTTPSISGKIVTGSGNDTIDVQAGTIGGSIALGAGADTLRLSSATLVGNVDFGDGADLLSLSGTAALSGSLTFGADASRIVLAGTSSYSGAITQGAGLLSLDVEGGTFAITNTNALTLSDLTIGATGTIAVNINTATGAYTSYIASGAATIASGAKMALSLTNFIGEEETYRIITAGSLSGGANLGLTTSTLPYLYSATLATSDTAGTIDLDLRRKTATELGLNRSGAAAYDAIYAAIPTDSAIESVFLGITDAATFKSTYASFLPDHGGGTFLAAMGASRAVAAMAADPATPHTTSGPLGLWIGEIAGYLDKSAGDSGGYKATNWSIAGGIDYRLPIGTVGLSFASAYNTIDDSQSDNDVAADQLEIGGYWHAEWGGLRANARAAISRMSFSSGRFFNGTADGEAVSRTSTADWSGTMQAAGGGASYEVPLGRFFVRPGAAVDYFKLKEDAHAETGGGTAFDLTLAERSSDQLAAALTLAGGFKIGSGGDGFALRVELEGGQREILRGAIGATTASFAGGNSFTLTADDLVAGTIAKLRLSGGNEFLSLSGEVSAEGIQDEMSIGAHVALKLRL